MLSELLENYIELQEQSNSIKKRMDVLKEQILSEMGSSGLTSYKTDDNIKGTIAMRETIKYGDEIAIINYLKNNGMENYVKYSIDTNFNKVLKSSQSLQESLKGKFTISESPALTVKRG